MVNIKIREDVLIVLNEGVAHKAKLAAELEEQLSLRGLCVQRLLPEINLAQIVIARSPIVIVLDYILANFGTALDILSTLKENPVKNISCVLWTDESSLYAAVSAMKLGAADYISFDTPKSLDRVIKAIENCLITNPTSTKNVEFFAQQSHSSQMIADSDSYRKCLAQAKGIAKQNLNLLILHGPHGSGRNSLAQYIHNERPFSGSYFELDYDTWSRPLSEIFSNNDGKETPALLSHASTVMIDHAEFDTSELISAYEKLKSSTFVKDSESVNSMLIIGTSSMETATAWARLFDATLIEIPGLEYRKEDLPALIKHFLSRTNPDTRINKFEYLAEVIRTLRETSWPGNLKQLCAVSVELASITLEPNFYQKISVELKQKYPELCRSNLTLPGFTMLCAAFSAKERWERYHAQEPYVPEKSNAVQALERASGNIRIAATLLGTGVSQIRTALNQHKNFHNSNQTANLTSELKL